MKEGSSVGIFKKILEKKGKPEENPPSKKRKENTPSGPVKTDPLAPSPESMAENERTLSSPKKKTDPVPPWEEAADESPESLALPRSEKVVDPGSSRAPPAETVPESPMVETPPTPGGPIDLLREKIRGAEQSLADMERTLGENISVFRGMESNLPKLKILLVEAKIKLAEADIKLSEAEITPSEGGIDEIESRVAIAAAKIGDAEKILSSLVSAGGKGGLSRLKIGLAAMKIRLAEIQIALAGTMMDNPPVAQVPVSIPLPEIRQSTASSPPPRFDTDPPRIIPGEESFPVREMPLPEQMKITERERESVPAPEPRIEPVRIKEELPEPTSSRLDQKEPVVMPGIDTDPSPFESGINRDRIRIRNEESSGLSDSQAPQERVKIRSDERESAWVTEDGSLKIVAKEKAGTEAGTEEERPRISIQQPEVEKVLVTEELNKRGIELRKKGDLEGAISCFDQVLEMDRDNEAALHNRGVALRSAGRYAEALESFDRALERDTDNPVIWFNRGFCLGKLERYEEALKAFDRVLAINPVHAAGWFNKGKILQKLGRMEEAEEHLKKAQELGYR